MLYSSQTSVCFPLSRLHKRAEETFWDVLQSKQPHPGVSVHSPLLSLAVWLAAVVHESCLVPLGPGINDPVLQAKFKQICTKHEPNISHSDRLFAKLLYALFSGGQV